MTNVQPRDEHDWLSSTYVDEWVEDWAARPERPAQLRRVAVALPFPREANARVLDVGGGWGPLTEEIQRYRPKAELTLLDFSQPMLEQASTRLRQSGVEARLVQGDLSEPGWTAGLEAPYDAVVSSLAIHNLRDPDLIARVYADIYDLLPDGGCFANLEIVSALGPRLGGIARRLRSDDAGTDPDDVEVPAAEPGSRAVVAPPPRSLEGQLQALRAAGFREVDCLWRNVNLALLVALR